MNKEKVWLVTGASKGLGLVLVQQLLAGGYKVAATSRTTQALTAAVGEGYGDRFLPLEVSLTSEQSVKDAVDKTIAAFGTIDVVVNNAGYGQIGTLEELSDEEARSNFCRGLYRELPGMGYLLCHQICRSRTDRVAGCGGKTLWRTGYGRVPRVFPYRLFISRFYSRSGSTDCCLRGGQGVAAYAPGGHQWPPAGRSA